jgi:mono/diheme cytochrome c family protein
MRALILLAFAVPLAAQVQAPTAFERTKVTAMLRSQLPCLGCHELDGEGGRVGPSLTTVADRRSAEYIRAIIEDPRRVIGGAPMPKVPMPPATRDLLVRYLTHRARPGSRPREAAPAPSNRAGSTIYANWCASCHGPQGNGDGLNAKYLPVPPAVHSSAAAMSLRSDDVLYDAISGGGAVMGKGARMPPFGATFSPAEIRSLVAYIRTQCNCRGPSWSLDGARQRAR